MRGSHNHLVLCLVPVAGVPMFQWLQLDEIEPGTIVCVARNAWANVVPTARESMLGVLCGAWVSEGWASDERAGFNNTDRSFFDDVVYAYDQLVGGPRYVSVAPDPCRSQERSTSSTSRTWMPSALVRWLR